MRRSARTTSRGLKTRDKVLDTAREVVLRAGPMGLSMRAVAKRANMSSVA